MLVEVKNTKWQLTKKNFNEGRPREFKQHEDLKLWSQYGGDVIAGEVLCDSKVFPIEENDWIVKQEILDIENFSVHKNEPTANTFYISEKLIDILKFVIDENSTYDDLSKAFIKFDPCAVSDLVWLLIENSSDEIKEETLNMCLRMKGIDV